MGEIMRSFKDRITPEYLENLAKESYKYDREYPENFSNWYPHIKDFGKFESAEIISNQIFTFDEVSAMQKCDNIDAVNWAEIQAILKPTLDKMAVGRLYSIKNGCFSNKFNFQTCITDKKHLAENLWKINYQSALFETGGYTELVVRDLIASGDNCPTIYNGMPLREEVRVFYDISSKKIEYMVDYWDYEYCFEYLNNATDKIIFDWFHHKIPGRSQSHQQILQDMMKYIVTNINTIEFQGLEGIWSIDFLYDSEADKVWLIDMARGFRSAYWDPDKLNT